jgi:hypothetical protein
MQQSAEIHGVLNMPGKFYDLNCRFCSERVLFYSQVYSTTSGALIPLDPDTYEEHKCPSPDNPYNKRKVIQAKFNKWMLSKAEREKTEISKP